MFLKLLKHDLISLKNSFFLLFIIVGAVALTMPWLTIGIFSAGGLLSSLLLILGTSFLEVAGILYAIVIFRFFHNTLFGKEAYLTWTLPSRASAVVISKLLASILWGLAFLLVAFLGIGLSLLMMLLVFNGSDALYSFFTSFSTMDVDVNSVISSIVYLFCNVLFYMGVIFFAMSLANSHALKKHHVVFFILIMAGFLIINNLLSLHLTALFPENQSLTYYLLSAAHLALLPLCVCLGILTIDKFLEI